MSAHDERNIKLCSKSCVLRDSETKKFIGDALIRIGATLGRRRGSPGLTTFVKSGAATRGSGFSGHRQNVGDRSFGRYAQHVMAMPEGIEKEAPGSLRIFRRALERLLYGVAQR